MKIAANFALLDVKRGRETLRKLVHEHERKIPVTIEGYITGDISGDDGTSIEFEVDVTKTTLGTPMPIACTCCRCAAKRAGSNN